MTTLLINLRAIILLLFSFSLEGSQQQASEIQFQSTLVGSDHDSSLSSVCNRAHGLNKGATLEVVHRQGPCSKDWSNKKKRIISSSLAEDILAKDQARVNSITELPARYGRPDLGVGNYIVTVGLGTPAKNLTLMFDTGSSVTWTQCLPCTDCYQQQEPIFDPSASTTYSTIRCSSKECHELDKYQGSDCDLECAYGVHYGDHSYTLGSYSRDTLTITQNHVFPGFLFGCGHNNRGLFGKTAGILGLGRAPMSFVSQTETNDSQIFSYCLPLKTSSAGFLTFGEHNNNNKAANVFTPLVPAPGNKIYTPIFYYIEITAISVGGTQLPVSESGYKMKQGTIIDSGSVITRLPPGAYKAMSGEFKKAMVKKYGIASAFSILDTCFHIAVGANTSIPAISITFQGNATLDLDTSGILYVVSSTRACLAFVGNTDPTAVVIFGNVQQRTFEVVYDVSGEK